MIITAGGSLEVIALIYFPHYLIRFSGIEVSLVLPNLQCRKFPKLPLCPAML
jgi:hypothetical protein